MGLRDLLARLAVRRVHVLLAEAPGHLELRVWAERLIADRGWVLAQSPADADVLVVVGEPDETLQVAVDRVYEQLPGPRARVQINQASSLTSGLDRARELLLDEQAQRDDARCRGAHPPGVDEEGHDDMTPSGIPLAEGAADRDGLEMDETHLFLGPILPHWPPGLSVCCTLHGDLVAGVEVLTVPRASDGSTGRCAAARRVDAAIDVLMLAGDQRRAARLRVLRDRCLAPTEDLVADLCDQRARLTGHRSLRWMLGETHNAVLLLLDQAAADLADARDESAPAPVSLEALLVGQDLATARLRLAAAGPDLWLALGAG